MQHRNTHFRGIGLASAKAMVMLLILGACNSALAVSLPNMGFCRNCSTAGFAWTAEQAAPIHSGIHPVYVLDPANGEVRYFTVEVWWDCGGNGPYSTGPGQLLNAVGKEAGVQSNCIQKEVTAGSGNSQIISDILDAHFAVLQLSITASQLASEDIPGAPGSAIDMVGPYDSSAGLNRLNLENGLRQHMSGIWNSIQSALNDVATRLSNRYLGSSDYFNGPPTFYVVFPDGTRIYVQIVQVSDGMGGTVLTFSVLQESAILPDGTTVPQTAGHMDPYQYQGSQDIAAALFALASRIGEPETLICEFHCDSANHCTLRCQRR